MSTLKTSNIANLSGTSTSVENVIYGTAKAYVNFNGTGTVAIRASYNVSSITDNGTGDYTVNFTSALADANYAEASALGDSAFGGSTSTVSKLASSFRFYSHDMSNSYRDSSYISVSFFR